MKETALQQNYLSGETVETIYLGGGTPSLLEVAESAALIDACKRTFLVADDAEVTLEANPDDITPAKLAGWKQAGINRLSIGVQSFFEEDLQWMNRAHNAAQAISGLQAAVKQFDNITVDLIYGTPMLSNEKWKHNVDTALALGIPHLSCYALTVEPRTPLHKMIEQHRSDDVDPGKQSEQFLLLMEWLEKAGYEHYEISNFAKPGRRSRHNSSYWKGKKYLGLGPSAHSFDGDSRQWNIANNNIYIDSISKGIIPSEKEELTDTQKLNEYIMISLRTMEGIDLQQIGETYRATLGYKSKRYVDNGLMTIKSDRLILTKQGKLLADGIAADLFC